MTLDKAVIRILRFFRKCSWQIPISYKKIIHGVKIEFQLQLLLSLQFLPFTSKPIQAPGKCVKMCKWESNKDITHTFLTYGSGMRPFWPCSFIAVHHFSSFCSTTIKTSPFLKLRSSASCIKLTP